LDLFCGPGKDEEGTLGSPLLALKVLEKFRGLVYQTSVEINLYFNDRDTEFIEQLKTMLKNLEVSKISFG